MSDVDDVIGAVGPRLREIRLRRDFTIAEVSAATGISASTLSRLEGGRGGGSNSPHLHSCNSCSLPASV